MKQLLFFILLGLSISQNTFAASLVSSVDRLQIREDETLNLTITLDDASFSGSPELGGLDSNFQIISQRSSSSTTIINGNYNSKKEWHYTLLPKKTGKLLIPSFKLKNTFSDAIEIDVLNASQDNSAQQGDLFLEQSVNKSEAYVQEGITLTLRIFTAIQIARPEIPPPSLPEFMVEKLGQSEYESKRGGRTYYVLEYKYALFSNKSGNVVLPRQRYQINQIINSGPRSLFNMPGFDVQNTQTRFLSSPEVSLNIKPQPVSLPAPYWLPSEDITMSDNWPEQQTVEAGTPLTRKIEIKALGNLAAHIPPLPADAISGLKSYAEQPELNNTHTNDNVLAIRKENIAIVPVQAGTYILPAISIHWWDTKNKQFKTSTLPERTITVKGTVTITPQPLQVDQATVINPPLTDSTPAAAIPFYMNVYLWMGTTAFFIMLWVVTLVVMLKKKNTTETVSSTDLLRQQSLKSAFKTLKIACAANDAKNVREELIHWAQVQWPDAEISTLQQVKQQINNAQFSKLVDELDGVLYRNTGSWNGKNLLDYLQTTQWSASPEEKTATLPGLYS